MFICFTIVQFSFNCVEFAAQSCKLPNVVPNFLCSVVEAAPSSKPSLGTMCGECPVRVTWLDNPLHADTKPDQFSKLEIVLVSAVLQTVFAHTKEQFSNHGHWSIGPLVECKMSKIKCKMSIRLNLCRSVPPEFLGSFLSLLILYLVWSSLTCNKSLRQFLVKLGTIENGHNKLIEEMTKSLHPILNSWFGQKSRSEMGWGGGGGGGGGIPGNFPPR